MKPALTGHWCHVAISTLGLAVLAAGCGGNRFDSSGVELWYLTDRVLHIVCVDEKGCDKARIGEDNHTLIITSLKIRDYSYDLSTAVPGTPLQHSQMTELCAKKGESLGYPNAIEIASTYSLPVVKDLAEHGIPEAETPRYETMLNSGKVLFVSPIQTGGRTWLIVGTQDRTFALSDDNRRFEIPYWADGLTLVDVESGTIVMHGRGGPETRIIGFHPKVVVWHFTTNEVQEYELVPPDKATK